MFPCINVPINFQYLSKVLSRKYDILYTALRKSTCVTEEKFFLHTQQTATRMPLFRSFGAFDYWNQSKRAVQFAVACANQDKPNFSLSIFLPHVQLLASAFCKCGKFKTNLQVQELRGCL